MDELEQGVGNPFDAPIPGQSLTDTPGNYPWEHPPQFTDPAEATEYLWQTLHREEFLEQVIGMLDAGVPIEALGRVLLFGGFMEGKFSPDVAFIITEPLMKMLLAIAVKAEIPKFKISMSDITNNEQLSSIAKIKRANQKTDKAIKEIQSDVKKTGIMSTPTKEDE